MLHVQICQSSLCQFHLCCFFDAVFVLRAALRLSELLIANKAKNGLIIELEVKRVVVESNSVAFNTYASCSHFD